MSQPEIMRSADAISVIKENKTSVDYYIFSEYEIHTNTIPPDSVQEWHSHSVIEETILITRGQMTFSWKDEAGAVQEQLLQKGDLVRVGTSLHTFLNRSGQDTDFVVFRFIPDGRDKRQQIKNDKTVVSSMFY